MLPHFIRVARWRDPYLDLHSHGGPLGPASKTAWVNIACLWLIYQFIWINSCVQGTNRPLRCYICQISRPKKEIKRGSSRHINKLFQNMAGWHCRASQTLDAIYLRISFKWRCHIKLIWNPGRRSIDGQCQYYLNPQILSFHILQAPPQFVAYATREVVKYLNYCLHLIV